MSLKYKYALFILIIHGALVVLLYHVLYEKKILFICSELLIVISLALSYALYRQLIRPLELMQSGSNALIENDFSIKYVNTGSKEMDKLIEVYNAMIDRLRVERTSMEEQSHFLNKLIEVSPIGILILDYDGKLTDANPRARSILNLSSTFEGLTLDHIDHPITKFSLNATKNDQELIDLNGVQKFKCQVSHVMHRGFPRKFVLIEELTNELLESEKRAYGKVIRMMAHEVNNSMGAVNSILNTIYDFGFTESEVDNEMKASLHVAIQRNDSLGVFMNNFAEVIRLPEPHQVKCDLNDLVRRTGQLYQIRANELQINIEYELVPLSLMVEVDPHQIEQVLSNCIKNAIESIGSGGRIYLKTFDDPAGFVVEDDGPGIPDSVSKKLFSPFYSTKPTGQGIGLMLCREILTNHKAEFSLSTDQDEKLTKFEVRFAK